MRGITTGLQDLTGKKHQIEHATRYPGGLQALTGKEQQFQHAYEVSGRDCRISRVGNIGSNMPTIYQVGAAGSHGLGTTDRTDSTYLRGIRSGLQDLTGKAHQIESAYTVSGRGCRFSRVGYYRSYMPTRHQEGTSGSHGFETQIERAYYR